MIEINSVFKYIDDNNEVKIRVVNIIDKFIYIVNLDGATSMPRKELLETISQEIEAEKLILIKDPFARIIDEKTLSELQINKRNSDWGIILKYWVNNEEEMLEKKSRNIMFEKISEEMGISVPKVKKLFSRYWQRGMSKNALLPDYINSGAKGKERKLAENKVGRPKKANYNGEVAAGINVTEEVKKHIKVVINKYYRNNNKPSLKEAYMLMLRDFYSDSYVEDKEIKHKVWDNGRIPTYDQFYYWFKKNEDIKKDITFRESEKEFNLKYRELLSNSKQETDGPGTRFQIDATVADVYLVSALNRHRVIGRPIVYAIIDVFSRLVTGIYVGLEGPSWLGAMMALDNMICDKVEFCKEYGIEIKEEQWPCKHIPEIIIADRGEFEGYSVENLINNLDVKIENTPPYRGDLKGIVERRFRTTNEKIKHTTPGAIQKEFRKRGDKDYRLDATLTLEDFTKIYITLVLYHNSKIIDKYDIDKEMLEDEIVPIPLQLWKWGIENRKGRLRTINREILRLNILPRGKASVSKAGIRFKGLYYSSDKAIKEQWFINNKIRSIEIVYDPRNMNKIYIPFDNGLSYDECYLIGASTQYKDCLLEEITFNQEFQRELKEKQMKEQNQNNIDLNTEIQKIVDKAKNIKEKDIDYNKSISEKLKGIKQNRSIEKAMNREKESFKLKEENQNDQGKIAEVIEIIRPKEAGKEDQRNNRLMEMIKRKRNEKK